MLVKLLLFAVLSNPLFPNKESDIIVLPAVTAAQSVSQQIKKLRDELKLKYPVPERVKKVKKK